MKKTLISLAILAATGSAYAQSNVTIYGIMDAGFVGERGGKNGSVSKVSAGVANASRIGFKGTEDLGGGLSAVFQLETGIKAIPVSWMPTTPCSTARHSSACPPRLPVP